MKHKKLTQSLLIAAVLALLYGLGRGEAGQVFLKGVRVCLECIGI